ncbi:MAG: TRAP transporter large permease subunit [Desulfobacterales bacterium]
MMTFITIALLFFAGFGIPLFIIIGGIALSAFYFVIEVSPATLFTDFFRITSAPAMVAIPLFIFAGYLLAESKTPRRLVNFSNALLGWMPGGLALVALVCCAGFTAFTGASGITIVAVGAILFPALLEEKYPEKFSLGLVTMGGGLGTLFIPCLPIIIYGVISKTNIEELFIAGLIPGFLRIVLNLGYTTVIGVKHTSRRKFSWAEVKTSLLEIIWELPLPFLIIGGIIGGLFSAGEAAAISAMYVLLVQLLITRDLDIRGIGQVIIKSMKMTGAIVIILGMALALTDVFIDKEVPMKVFDFINKHIESKIAFLLLLNVFLLIIGAAMDIISACVVIVPIIVPVAQLYGIDPVHLGIIFLANLELGFITPPVGMSLFISSLKFNKPLPTIVVATLPFFIIALVGLLLITYIPDLSLFLVRLFSKSQMIDPASLL